MRISVAVLTLACLAACSRTSGLPGIPVSQATGPSIVRSGSLQFKVFTAGQTPGFPASAAAIDIAPGPGGTMWFTDGGTPAIGRIASDGTITEFTNGLPPGAQPYSIVAGPDGRMWFSDHRGVAIGKVTPAGAITEYDASQYGNSDAMGIAFGSRGEPWIVGFGSQPLLAHLTRQRTFEAQLLPVRMTPNGALTADARGDLWFIAQNPHTRGELVERRAHSDGLFRTPLHMLAAFLPCCPNVAPKSIVIGPNGEPWFTTLYYVHRSSPANFLGTLQTGRVALFRIRNKGLSEVAYPSGLAAAAHGLWITGGDPFADNGALWHVDDRGKQIVYDLPHNPFALALDAAGNPWFTAAFSGQPSRIVEAIGAK